MSNQKSFQGIGARRLLYWCRQNERRQRIARTGIGRLSPWVVSVTVAVIFAALLGWLELRNSNGVAHRIWFAAVISFNAIVMFGGTFRLFWHPDVPLLRRLSISGRTLFRVGVLRGFRPAICFWFPTAFGSLAFVFGSSWDIALRHFVLASATNLGAMLLGPAVALLAGALVASEKAQGIFANMGGEFQAPKTSWLGVLPGMTAAVFFAVIVAGSEWAEGAARTPVVSPMVFFTIVVSVPLVTLLWALSQSKVYMSAALLEVSALDRERLAHIEKTRLGLFERWTKRALRLPETQVVFTKDATLMARRYPMAAFLGWMGVLVLWLVALVFPGSAVTWVITISALLGVYGVIVATRLTASPLEHMLFIRTLPIRREQVHAAKRAYATLWVLRYLGLGCIPAIFVLRVSPMWLFVVGILFSTVLCVIVTLQRTHRSRMAP